MSMSFYRGRRLRKTPQLRALLRETAPLCVEDLIMPYFVVETKDNQFAKPVPSMPGQCQLSLAMLEKRVAKACDLGLTSILLLEFLPTRTNVLQGPMIKTALCSRPLGV